MEKVRLLHNIESPFLKRGILRRGSVGLIIRQEMGIFRLMRVYFPVSNEAVIISKYDIREVGNERQG